MGFLYGAHSDIGLERRLQEDYMMCKEYDNNNYGKDLLAIIADGTGTADDRLQPAVLATNTIIESIDYVKNEAPNLFDTNPLFFLQKAMLEANSVIGALKIANEEFYSGYGASVSVLYLSDDKIFYAHAGNTRIYILRQGTLHSMTTDHTLAQQKLENNDLSIDYYLSSDRLKVTNGIGIVADPKIDVGKGKMKDNDIFILTTDGVHYAIRPEFFPQIILESPDTESAARSLVLGARDEVKYPDNMTAIVIVQNK